MKDAEDAWKEEFRSLLSDASTEVWERAFQLKDNHLPERLYKFCRPSNCAFENLESDSVYLASPSQFNDPFDCGLMMNGQELMTKLLSQGDPSGSRRLAQFGMTEQDLVEVISGKVSQETLSRLTALPSELSRDQLRLALAAFPEILETEYEQIAEAMRQVYAQSVRVTCFSERADSLLLWAHYAHSHQGFCVEYHTSKLPRDGQQRRLLFPVFYEQVRFDGGEALFKQMQRGPMPNLTVLAALQKSTDWAYEREWRIVVPGRSEHPMLRMPPPVAVYAGLKMRKEDRSNLENICKRKGIQLLTPRLSGREYKIELCSTGY